MEKANLTIKKLNDEGKEMVFEVEVSEGGSSTRHVVEVDERSLVLLAGECAEAEELIRRSFEFLLERESKESILRQFHIMKIDEYFPEYQQVMRKLCGLK